MSQDVMGLLGQEDDDAAPARFGQQERRGHLLGLTTAQVVILSVTAAIDVAALLIFQLWAWPIWLISVAVIAFTVWRVRGEPVVSLLATQSRFARRGVSGQTRYRRDVWEPRWDENAMPLPDAPTRSVRSLGSLRFPGALGDCQLYDIDGAGGFIHDRRARRASITLAVLSNAWQLQDSGAQAAAVGGFMGWLNGLEQSAGIAGAVIRVRADRSSSTELADYFSEHGDPAVSRELRREYAQLIQEGAGRAFAFSSSVSITFDLVALEREIHDAGGGIPGLAHVLEQRVGSLAEGMESMRVRVEAWLSGDELEAMCTTSWDPTAAARRRADGNDTLLRAPVMGIEERWTSIRSDESVHRVMWVSEWPRQRAIAGFLEPLLMSGTSSRTVVIELIPHRSDKALKAASKALTDMELTADTKARLGYRVTRKDERAAADVAARERDLVNGHSELAFRGFLVVSAESDDALSRGARDVETAAHRAKVVVQTMHGQQAAAFVRAVLPAPIREDD